MKNFLKFIAVSIILSFAPAFAQYTNEFEVEDILTTEQNDEITLEEPSNIIDDSQENTITQETAIFKEVGNKDNSEDSLFKKVLKTEITRTDIPSFLLKEGLTFKYQKGPVSELQFFGAYRGSMDAIFKPHHNTLDYDNLTNEIGVYGKFKNKDNGFKISFQPVPKKGNYLEQMVNDVYWINTQIPHHTVIVGRSRLQTSVEGGASTYVLPFVTRSQIARNFGSARSTAVSVSGNFNYADYNISLGSSGRYFISGFPGAEFNGWVNLKPFGSSDGKYGRLTIGGGLNAGHYGDNYTVGTVYVGYKHKKLWTNFEAAIADGYNGANGHSDKKACGYAFTAGWKFTPKLQLIGRIDQFDPNRDISGNLKREYTIGLNYFIKGQALKLVLNWVYCQNQNQQDSQKIILATQIVL